MYSSRVAIVCSIHRSQVLSREWRYSWSSSDRRCSNEIWVINNLLPTKLRLIFHVWWWFSYILLLVTFLLCVEYSSVAKYIVSGLSFPSQDSYIANIYFSTFFSCKKKHIHRNIYIAVTSQVHRILSHRQLKFFHNFVMLRKTKNLMDPEGWNL